MVKASRLVIEYLKGDKQALEELDALAGRPALRVCMAGAHGLCVEHGQALADCKKDP